VSLELAATLAGGALLWLGLATRSNTPALAALVIWITTFQPLLKLAVGLALGVRYDYAYLLGVEPRIKMRFGTYLAASRPTRILLHLSGCIGSPLAAWAVGRLARPTLPLAATVATALFWSIAGLNAGLLLAGVGGLRHIGKLRIAISSGGRAGMELREALSSRA
jgi:hypothetical protein